jgi:hypothetical protein
VTAADGPSSTGKGDSEAEEKANGLNADILAALVDFFRWNQGGEISLPARPSKKRLHEFMSEKWNETDSRGNRENADDVLLRGSRGVVYEELLQRHHEVEELRRQETHPTSPWSTEIAGGGDDPQRPTPWPEREVAPPLFSRCGFAAATSQAEKTAVCECEAGSTPQERRNSELWAWVQSLEVNEGGCGRYVHAFFSESHDTVESLGGLVRSLPATATEGGRVPTLKRVYGLRAGHAARIASAASELIPDTAMAVRDGDEAADEAAAVHGNAHLWGCTEATAELREEDRGVCYPAVEGRASRRGKVDAREGDGA